MIFLFLLIIFLPILFLIFILPIGYLIHGFLNLLTVPLQIIEIAVNRKLRKNHALEHATINVLEDRSRRKNIFSGYARENGFYVFGPASPYEIFSSSIEGRERLINGEKNLAIHNRCGTSIAVASFLTFLVFFNSSNLNPLYKYSFTFTCFFDRRNFGSSTWKTNSSIFYN